MPELCGGSLLAQHAGLGVGECHSRESVQIPYMEEKFECGVGQYRCEDTEDAWGLVGMTSDVADRNGFGNFVCGLLRPE
jgi:hypothetical protein